MKHILDSMTGDLTTVLGDDFGNYAFPALVPWADSWQSWRTAFLFVTILFWVFLLQVLRPHFHFRLSPIFTLAPRTPRGPTLFAHLPPPLSQAPRLLPPLAISRPPSLAPFLAHTPTSPQLRG